MTTTPYRTPGPCTDKENNPIARTPNVNLPSTLKLGTPFFRGTRRHRDAVSTTSTPLAVSEGRIGTDTPTQAPMESTSFPDELPLELFRQQWSPRKSPTVKASTEDRKEKTRNDVTLVPNEEDSQSTPFKETEDYSSRDSQKKRKVHWDTTEKPLNPSEKWRQDAQTTSLVPASIGELESKEYSSDVSIEDDQTVQDTWENEYEATPVKLSSYRIEEPDSPVEEMNHSLDARSEITLTEDGGDDFSAMIDALAADFQQEIAQEQKKLESLSSGDIETDNNPDVGDDTLVGCEKIKLLEKELQSERETREKLVHTYSQERKHLLEQIKEVQISAELSIRLAREDAKHLVQEERLLLLQTREEMEIAQDHAIAEATRQATELLKESKKRQDELHQAFEKQRSKHAAEIKSALAKAREEAQKSTAASLSIQRAATAQTLQREIFNMETELLETLDELDTTKAEMMRDKNEFKIRISELEQELEKERKDKENTVEGLEKDVEMFRVQLEADKRATVEQQKKDESLKNLVKRIALLEEYLEEANKTIESTKEEKDRTVSTLESEVTRLTDLLSSTKEKLTQESSARKEISEENDLLQTRIKEFSETIERMKIEKSQSCQEVASLRRHFMQLQEQSNEQRTSATMNQKEANTTRAKNCAIPPSGYVFPEAIPSSTSSLMMSPGISSNFEPIRVGGNGAFDLVRSEKEISGRENPNAAILELDTTLNDNSVTSMSNPEQDATPIRGTQPVASSSANPASAFNGTSKTPMPVKTERRLDVEEIPATPTCTKADKDGVLAKSSLGSTKPTTRRSSLVPPQRTSNLRTPSIRSSSSTGSRVPNSAQHVTPARVEKNKVKPIVPQIASNTKEVLTVTSSRIPESLPRSATSRNKTTRLAIPATRSKLGLPKPSTAKAAAESKLVACKSSLPSRRASHVPQGNAPSRSRLSTRSSGIPRTIQKASVPRTSQKGTPTTRIDLLSLQTHPKNDVSMTPPKSDESVHGTPARLRSPATRSIGELPPEPSSQQVRDKFSSLCQTWSNTKTPKPKIAGVGLPQSLKLDFRFDSSVDIHPTQAMKSSTTVNSSIQQSSNLKSWTERAHSVHPAPFLIGDIASGDDEDLLLSPVPKLKPRENASNISLQEEDDLLVSPAPKANHMQKDAGKKTIDSIVHVQACVRAFLAKKDYQERILHQKTKIQTADVIQSSVRCLQAQSSLQKRKISAEMINMAFRRFLFGKRVRARTQERRASVIIQSKWKAILQRLKYLKKKDAVIRIQCTIRCIKAKKWFQGKYDYLSVSAILIQSYWRRTILERNFQLIRKMIILVQADFRCFRERSKYSKLKGGFSLLQERARNQRTKRVCAASATKIENAWRRSSAHNQFRRDIQLIILIQSLARRVAAKMFVENLKRNSATVIQKALRRRICRTTYKNKKTSVLVIQNFFRGLLERKSKIRQRHSQNEAAKTISTSIKCFCERKRMEKAHKAVLKVQKLARGASIRSNIQKMITAATSIQSEWRRRTQSCRYAQLKIGALRIQRLFRSTKIKNQLFAMKHGMIRLQAITRGRGIRRSYVSVVGASLTIQSQWRRQRTMKLKNMRILAIIKLQSWARCQFVLHKCLIDNASAIRLQSFWRMTQAVIQFRKTKSCVFHCQAVFRGCLMMNRFEKVRRQVICIQNLLRRKVSRRCLVLLQEEQKAQKELNAVVKIQNWFRCVKACTFYRLSQIAAKRIQTRARTKKLRKSFLDARRDIVFVQKTYRSIFGRRSFLKSKECAVLIQQQWRQYISTSQRRRTLDAVIKLQAWARECYLASQYERAKISIVKIQSAIRGKLAQRQFRILRRSIIIVQSQCRRMKATRNLFVVQRAARLIQQQWRHHQNFIAGRKSLGAILKLQARARMFLSMVKLSKIESSVVRIQSTWRGSMTLERYRSLRSATVTLQSIVRARLASKGFALLQKKANMIQSCVRARAQRCQFLILKKSTQLVQKQWRKHVAVTKLKVSIIGFVKLQVLVRKFIALKSYRCILNSIVKIQCFWRMASVTQKFMTTRSRILRLQSFIRTWIWTKNYRTGIESSMLIQKTWRAYKSRATYESRIKSAVLIQKVWRSKKYAALLQEQMMICVVSIQSWGRSRLETKRFYTKRQASIILQKSWRGFAHRRKIVILRKAATVIQARWRVTKQISLYKLLKRNVTLIQSSVRKRIAQKRVWKKQEENRIQKNHGSKAQSNTVPPTPGPSQKRIPLTSLRNTESPGHGTGRQPLTSLTKTRSRRPLGDVTSTRNPLRDVSSVFSPAKTRGLKRRSLAPFGQENSNNVMNESPSAKRQKTEGPRSSHAVAFPEPEKMKVVELREALQGLGVRSKDIRKLRKAQLIVMIQQIQQGTDIHVAVTSLTA